MDDLHGDQAVWRFDGESIAISYLTKGWFKDPLLKRLGRIDLPVGVIAEVDFQPGAGRRKGWVLRLGLRERMDPYAAVGATLKERSQPFRLTGQIGDELVAEYLADQIRFAAEQRTGPPAPDTVTRLVPRPPLHIQTSEGTATIDDSGVRLVWSGGSAGGRKRKVQRREYALTEITGAEWSPADEWEWGYLRVVTGDGTTERAAKPKHDLNVLRANEGVESSDALLMAATITAHVWALDGADDPRSTPAGGWRQTGRRALERIAGSDGRPPERTGAAERGPSAGAGGGADTEWIFRQIEHLGDLHARGLLTDEEFTAKKAELLDRI